MARHLPLHGIQYIRFNGLVIVKHKIEKRISVVTKGILLNVNQKELGYVRPHSIVLVRRIDFLKKGKGMWRSKMSLLIRAMR
jgi:hypothetical protein